MTDYRLHYAAIASVVEGKLRQEASDFKRLESEMNVLLMTPFEPANIGRDAENFWSIKSKMHTPPLCNHFTKKITGNEESTDDKVKLLVCSSLV